MISKRIRPTAVVKSDYDRNATRYDRVRFGSVGGQYVSSKEREFVMSNIKSSRVLEVGTATGRFAVSLNDRGAEYTGVDLSRKMLRITFERTDRRVNVVQMDGSELGFRTRFNSVLCMRTFHFMHRPVGALRGMFNSLEFGGRCVVTFETDNFLRRLLLFLKIGTSEQYYYKISDIEKMFELTGFKVVKSGSVMRLPVTLYRICPKFLLPIVKRLEKIWPWSMHDFVMGLKPETFREEFAIGDTPRLALAESQ